MKKFIQITCPECSRELRIRFKFGYQIVLCDIQGMGCGDHFAIDVDLTVEEEENETSLYYTAEVFSLVPAAEQRFAEDVETLTEMLERLARILYPALKNDKDH